MNFVVAGAATHFEVVVPKAVKAGQTFAITVIAEDASNHPAAGYTGTIQVTLGTADTNATLPAAYTFTASDHGMHVFLVTLSATGNQTIIVTDTTTNSITGQAALVVNGVGVVTHFQLVALGQAVMGSPAQFLVLALDASNQVVPGYTGTVQFTSSDGNAILPPSYTFLPSDKGSHVFTVTFETSGKQTVTAADTNDSSIDGSFMDMVLAQLPQQRHPVGPNPV